MKVEFPTDLQIARQARLLPMPEVAARMGIGPHLLEPYGHDVAKIKLEAIDELRGRPMAKYVVVSGRAGDGVSRQAGFDSTAASAVMTGMALRTSLQDMRKPLGRIVSGNTTDGKPITAEELHASGAMTVGLRDAIKPNLLQTLENTPVLVHAGPFGNIPTGHPSVSADFMGIHCGEF